MRNKNIDFQACALLFLALYFYHHVVKVLSVLG